ILGFDLARGEAAEDCRSCAQSSVDSFQNFGVVLTFHKCIPHAAHSMRTPVTSKIEQSMRRNHGTGTRVLKCEPSKAPGIEPISREATNLKSTLPARKCKALVTPVSTTACTISVPTMTFGA